MSPAPSQNASSQNLLAAAISVGISAILFAYAILPASPSLIA